MLKSANKFAHLLNSAKPTLEEGVPLTNVTFFLGAGFSKSWDEAFPVGNDLFFFAYDEWVEHDGPLEEFLALNNYQPVGLDIAALMFKDIVYQIGMMKKYSEMRPRYIDNQNLDMVEKHLRFLVRKKFEQTAPLYYEEAGKLTLPSAPNSAQKKILDFFKAVKQSGDGSQGLPEGLRAHYLTTNYDFVIETVLDQILAPDDSYRLYTYRGITPLSYCGRDPEMIVFDNWMTGNLLKINGGFEIFKTEGGFEFDYRRPRNDDSLRRNPPQLMLASREQDYTQSYFRAMFPKVIRLLHETKVLVVVGYSLPDEDALLRLIVRQFAEDRADGNDKLLFYIDMSAAETQLGRVNEIFPHVGELHGLTVIPHSGSFSNWCGEVTNELKRLNAPSNEATLSTPKDGKPVKKKP